MKINKEESLKRMMAAMPSEEEMKNMEEPPIEEWSDSDLVVLYGTLLAARAQGHEVDAEDMEKEFMRRASRHVLQMLMEEGLLAMEGDNAEED